MKPGIEHKGVIGQEGPVRPNMGMCLEVGA